MRHVSQTTPPIPYHDPIEYITIYIGPVIDEKIANFISVSVIVPIPLSEIDGKLIRDWFLLCRVKDDHCPNVSNKKGAWTLGLSALVSPGSGQRRGSFGRTRLDEKGYYLFGYL
ncbi:hypothetical protein Zmor_009708 [Zophobas morio]|uniref:Uncharacterized protein n=1 Tax=Zophobas morio TaxID=2755281 RepID=A0AA38IJF1_9CUCU|nr:hypothetical protein Zmor_009708 [Zophobas morio]